MNGDVEAFVDRQKVDHLTDVEISTTRKEKLCIAVLCLRNDDVTVVSRFNDKPFSVAKL